MINSQINILAQAEKYLKSVSAEHYKQVVKPLFISSAGQHIRHILDHYLSIMAGMSTGIVDYDKRSRGGNVETERDAALSLISEIASFLHSLSEVQLAQTIKLSSEVNIAKKQVVMVNSTLARELIFVGSHAIHHFAMIEQIAKAQDGVTPDEFGIAPTTATHLRDTSCAR